MMKSDLSILGNLIDIMPCCARKITSTLLSVDLLLGLGGKVYYVSLPGPEICAQSNAQVLVSCHSSGELVHFLI